METANAFDMLILPMFQCTAAILATFPVLRGLQVGLGRLFGRPEREPETVRIAEEFRMAGRPNRSRADRSHHLTSAATR